jgi:hypothetical protein
MKKLIATLLLLAGIQTQAQDSTSENLIGSYNLTGTVTTDSTGGGYSDGSIPGYNPTTNTILFGYTLSTVAYTYALSQALQTSGLIFTGYNYSWDYLNFGDSRGSLTANVNFIGINGATLYTRSWSLGQTGSSWRTESGTETFASGILTSTLANFSLSFTGQDDRFWAGYYGPQVRDPSLSINYTFDACVTNPLSSPTCPGYETAYQTQQCTVSALYSPSCPGYAVAYLEQQCAANPLYSTTCPGYAEAYAKKNVLATSSTNNTIVIAQVTTDPVAQAAPMVSDPVVNSVITTRPATNADANPAAPVKLTAPASAATAQDSATSEKKSNKTQPASADKSGNKPKTTREAIAEKQREKAQNEAVARGKELANEMGKAADMAAQVAVQNVVIQAMGYTPGFDNYNRAFIPDGAMYRPYEAYPGQRNIDTPTGRGLFGSSDSTHQQMIDKQYNLGK